MVKDSASPTNALAWEFVTSRMCLLLPSQIATTTSLPVHGRELTPFCEPYILLVVVLITILNTMDFQIGDHDL